VTEHTGYWPSRWPAEDGGPRRLQTPRSGRGLGLAPGERLTATSRDALVATMPVLRDDGEVFVLRHTGGDAAISFVEQIHPESLEALARSVDLPGGPTWPGGLAAHADGSLYVVFGRHAHRLTPRLELVASRELPRPRPYNSFVVLPDGVLVTKDFGGTLPGTPPGTPGPGPAELLVLAPDDLAIVARLDLPERSIARLSARGSDVYVVGDTSLLRVRWTGRALELDEDLRAPYRTIAGQTYGWDAVITDDAAWFLDNGAGSEGYAGTFRGRGASGAPLHLVRVALDSGAVTLSEICGRPNGIVANPPAIDVTRSIAVGYDSGNGVVTAFDIGRDGATTPRWSRPLHHACHPLVFPDTGEIVLTDHDAEALRDDLVVLDIETGDERGRVATGSPVQSVVFPAPGFERDLYYCSFTTLARITVEA
jgi:hypothetical protein